MRGLIASGIAQGDSDSEGSLVRGDFPKSHIFTCSQYRSTVPGSGNDNDSGCPAGSATGTGVCLHPESIYECEVNVSLLEDDQQVLGAIPNLTPHCEIALLARALHRTGWDDGHLGHITYLQPDHTLLTLPMELGWNEVTASDIVRMDLDGNKIEGRGSITPAIRLHTEFHKARPGVGVTVHQHPRFATIWSACGRIPPVYDQRSAFVADDDIVLWDENVGSVDNVHAAQAAVAAMGAASFALLRNHGVMVVADSIEQAYNRATALEWRCQQAWRVEAIGGKNAMPKLAQESIVSQVRPHGGVIGGLWEWAVRGELRNDPTIIV